jgi:hypothetical protein
MRRFTRLTNAFSKKGRKPGARCVVALHAAKNGNGYRTTQRLPDHPPMAAGVADQVWSLAEIAGLLD